MDDFLGQAAEYVERFADLNDEPEGGVCRTLLAKLLNGAAKPENKLADAKRQGQAQFDSIREMVEALKAAREADAVSHTVSDRRGVDTMLEDAERAIQEDALSVQVRSGWENPGAFVVRGDPRTTVAPVKPSEYKILLCTGGPACRIVGELSEHCEPTSARLEVQDWFQPWTAMRPRLGPSGAGWRWDESAQEYRLNDAGEGAEAIAAPSYDSEPILLDYARCFWFGE